MTPLSRKNYSVWQWWRVAVYVFLHDCVKFNVRVCSLHNPHHTGQIENYNQHTVGWLNFRIPVHLLAYEEGVLLSKSRS